MEQSKRLNILSFAKFQGALFMLLGLLAGILYAFGGLLLDSMVSLGWMRTDETNGLGYGTVLAFGALVGMPLILGGTGYILGLLQGLIYNLWFRTFDLGSWEIWEN